MRVLVGTDILLCYLYDGFYIDGINCLFKWMEAISIKKLVDISSIAILTNLIPLSNFDRLKDFEALKEVHRKSNKLRLAQNKFNKTEKKDISLNSKLVLLNLLDIGVVDFLITEDKLSHCLAADLGLDNRVYTIENFIEKCTIEYREFDESKGAIVQMCKFKTLSLKDPFFYDFIQEYSPGFKEWFKRKANDDVFICKDQNGNLRALLKLKVEDLDEDYRDIKPLFHPAIRLKICSFKVDYNGEKLGERFLRIIFEQAILNKVSEIYVTIFNDSKSRERLISMIENWGFSLWGNKISSHEKNELVYVKKMHGLVEGNHKYNYPYHVVPQRSILIPIGKTYALQLLPSDTLFNNHLDIMPAKHSIQKVIITSNLDGLESIESGNGLLIYQNANIDEQKKLLAVGIVEKVFQHFKNFTDFQTRCRKRSILSNNDLLNLWREKRANVIVIEFLYLSSLDEYNLNFHFLKDKGINTDKLNASKIIRLCQKDFLNLLEDTDYEKFIDINKTYICRANEKGIKNI